MNISNLSEGMTIKNYTQLCTILGEDVKGGKSKIYQLEDFERYFEFEKQGHKFIISKIYDEPKAKKVDRAVYVKFIELLLMYELSTKENYTCHYTKTNLFHLLGMVNQFYLKNNRYLVNDKISNISKWQRNDFYQRSNQKLTNILFSALNSMKSRRLLSYFHAPRERNTKYITFIIFQENKLSMPRLAAWQHIFPKRISKYLILVRMF